MVGNAFIRLMSWRLEVADEGDLLGSLAVGC
jgi:hypothetical protein